MQQIECSRQMHQARQLSVARPFAHRPLKSLQQSLFTFQKPKPTADTDSSEWHRLAGGSAGAQRQELTQEGLHQQQRQVALFCLVILNLPAAIKTSVKHDPCFVMSVR